MTNKSLNKEELEKVTGGGSGYAENGITFSNYDMPESNRYYSLFDYLKNTDKVFYVTSVNGNYVYGNVEYIYIDGKNWKAEYYYKNLYTSIESFKKDHPYVLNIRP